MKARKIFGISLSLIIINLASIMERADENLLPSVYKEVSEAFNAGPSDLGYLTFIRPSPTTTPKKTPNWWAHQLQKTILLQPQLQKKHQIVGQDFLEWKQYPSIYGGVFTKTPNLGWRWSTIGGETLQIWRKWSMVGDALRNFIQGLASPMAGILVLTYDRPTVLAMGTLCWALSTAAVGGSRYFSQVAFWRAVNGFGLAIVIPALQSFIADTYSDSVRGTGFGFLSLVGMVGGIGGGVVATVMAGHEFWGVPGWRCAFVLMAMLSCSIGCLVFMFVVDPKRLITIDRDGGESYLERNELLERGRDSSTASVWTESWMAMKAVVKVQTFQIIVLQGLVGSLPWTAMVFFTMWFELIGFDHQKAATLLSLFGAGCSFGSLLGGIIADRLSQIYPHSARIMCAQFSAIMGIPYTWFLLRVIPQSVDSYVTYAITLLLMGLTISWNGTAANAPMFAEVVPSKHRTMIYAFDRAFEGSFSSFAAPLVGILAEKIYGYDSKSVDPISGSTREALALSKGLFTMMAIPFGLCCLFYTPLYRVFRRDRDNVRLAALKEEEMI